MSKCNRSPFFETALISTIHWPLKSVHSTPGLEIFKI